MSDTPLGVTVLVTDAVGDRVIGTGSDFERQAPGGWELREAQERRARNAAWWQAFNRTCRTEVANVINQSGLIVDELRHKLMSQHDWRELVIVHGHEEEGD